MSVAALLLNWKRPQNMPKVIESIRNQTVPIEIMLWNNSPKPYPGQTIHSTENFFCWPRWLMAGLTTTEYIFTLDDDLYLTDPKAIENCLSAIKEMPHDTVFGIAGVILNAEISYWKSQHTGQPGRVDIVKGRFMFTRRKFVASIPLGHEYSGKADDIFVSSRSTNKYILAALKNAYANIPDTESVCLSGRKGTRELREEAALKMFG